MNQLEMKNLVMEIKNTLEGVFFNRRSKEAEEWISYLEDRVTENNQAEQQKERRTTKNEDRLRELNDIVSIVTFALKGS